MVSGDGPSFESYGLSKDDREKGVMFEKGPLEE